MNIWFFIILIVAIAMVIGPISMLRPSLGQKRKEDLRLHANKHAVRFSMRRLPALKTDIEQAAPIPVYYLPPLTKSREISEWIIMRTHYVHEGNFYLEWDWQTDVRPNDATTVVLKTYLPQLPASVTAISRSNMGMCVFWSEQEGVETLDLLIEMIRALQHADTEAL